MLNERPHALVPPNEVAVEEKRSNSNWYWAKYPTWVKVLVIIGALIGVLMGLISAKNSI